MRGTPRMLGGELSGEATAFHATSHAASLLAQLQRLPPHELESVIEALIPQTA